jgi:uncharacterized membrane protein
MIRYCREAGSMAVATQVSTSRYSRFWEIDLLRTIAIAMMITFHVLYLAHYFGITTMTIVRYGFWWWFPRVTAGTFIFLAGVSLTIAHSMVNKPSGFVLRGLKIFAWGMGITAVTLLIPGTDYVRFGILHFFGIAFIVGTLLLRFRLINLILGVAVMILGFHLEGIRFDFPWLLWLGLIPRDFVSVMDYVPMLPWFGIFLLGMFGGKMLYPQGNRRFSIPEFNNPVALALTLPGKHPLVIYLAQWPAIIGVLLLLYPANVLPYFPPLPF